MTNKEYIELRGKYARMLKILREAKKMTLKTVAKYIGVTQKAVWNWENTIQIPSAYSAYKLAIFYGVPYEVICCMPPKKVNHDGINNPMIYNIINMTERELHRFVKRAQKRRIDSIDFYL